MIYDIHICKKSEKRELQKFIDTHWSKGHIMSYCDELMDFMHYDQKNDQYNFLIARNTQTGEIDGIFGFVAHCQYDEELADDRAYFGVIWKVRNDVKNEEIGILGTLLWRNILKLPSLKYYMTSGISEIAKRFYTIARLKVSALNQYYILSQEVDQYRIAKIPASYRCEKLYSDQNVEIKNIEADDLHSVQYPYVPFKSVKYVKTRYFKHPIYRYKIFGVYHNNVLLYGLICRKIETQNSACLRVVDIFGKIEGTPNIYFELQKVLKEDNCEYIDCLNSGIQSDHFLALGFQLLDPHQDQIIIPNYFEPFLRKNITIECVHTAAPEFVIFKGDGDQDRPNIIVKND